MNKKSKIINLFMIAITITLLISISGCQQKQKKINQVKKENKVPQKLGSILDDIEKVEKGIKGIQKESEKSPEIEIEMEKQKIIKKLEEEQKLRSGKESGSGGGSQQGQGGEQSGGGSGGEGGSSGGGSEGSSSSPASSGSSGSSKEEGMESEEIQKVRIHNMWKDINGNVESIHKKWSDYKVEAIKKKANDEEVKKFEEKLNNLTISAEKKDYLSTLVNNNEMYSGIYYFLKLYENYDAEIIALKYDVDKVYIDGLKGDWNKTNESMKKVDSQYKKVSKELDKKLKQDTNAEKEKEPKNKKEKEEAKKKKKKKEEENKKKKEQLSKLGLAIDSMKESLNSKDIKLLEIKKEIINENIKTMREK